MKICRDCKYIKLCPAMSSPFYRKHVPIERKKYDYAGCTHPKNTETTTNPVSGTVRTIYHFCEYCNPEGKCRQFKPK